MADQRPILEPIFDRVREIVRERLDQADEISRYEIERSRRRHREKLRRLEREDRRAERREVRRERRHRRNAPPEPPRPPDEPRPRSRRRGRTPEQRAYRAARRRANLRLLFYTHFAVYGSVLLLLLGTTRSFRAVFIVAMSWGIGVFLHYFWAVIAPDLRERWVEREVGQRVGQDVDSERRRVEDRHVRTMENLSASIAHEIRNPITAAKSLVQQMGEDPVAQTNLEYASVALEELDRVERSISHLLRFARDEELRFESIRLQEVVTSAIETFRDRLGRSGVSMDTQLDTPGDMEGDSDKLRRVVINLVGNAIDALEQAGTPSARIEVMAGDNLAGSEVWLRVRDNGPGIPDETRAKIFDPFYTTKSQGTGLGLALSRKVVEAHGGAMEVTSSPETGTEFVLVFPKEQPHARDAKHAGGGDDA